MSDDIEEIKRSVGDVREWLKDQRFTDDDREPDSNINISIQQLNRALALMMVVEMEIERLREALRIEQEEFAACCIDRKETQRERDEARREVCELSARCVRANYFLQIKNPTHLLPKDVAKSRGWDCFNEVKP